MPFFHALILPAGGHQPDARWADIHARLLPGAFGLAMVEGNAHRLACAIEDGGFIMHPSVFCLTGERLLAAILFQKPYSGSPVDCITRCGAGALNIEAARIPVAPGLDSVGKTTSRGRRLSETWEQGSGFKNEKNDLAGVRPEGRWPANLALVHRPECRPGRCLPACPVKQITSQSGISTNTRHMSYRREGSQIGMIPKDQPERSWFVQETGGAGRFFHQASGADPAGLWGWLATLLLPPPAYAPRRLLVLGDDVDVIQAAARAGWEEVAAG